ncbi:hypothetical protein [Lentzea sp. NPDC055074]
MNRAFGSSSERLEQACVVAASAAAGATTALDGQMIDRPVVLRARALLVAHSSDQRSAFLGEVLFGSRISPMCNCDRESILGCRYFAYTDVRWECQHTLS